jgi:chemotaxis protein MotB|nr:OmpA family protein [Candidatus Delongbacteria bacterium]
MKEKKERCEAERDDLKAKNEEISTQKTEMQAELERLRDINKGLIRDTAIKGSSYRTLTVQYGKINELYNTLLENTEKLREGADAETKKALAMLEEARNELQQKEDELRALEERLNKEKANLNALRTELQIKEAEINKKNKQLAELQSVLNRKDSVVNVLRKKVSDALLGFEGEGLTVTKKNGKVYVSLEEKLLFESGKWAVDPQGQKALEKLAEVLEKNPDINIMIEGHTDDLEYHGRGNIEDNWDLSVKRATAIVKILLQKSNIDPQRLIAAGRGEYLPVDPAKTTEARRKNRRIEIILTPKLDELFEIMNIQ